jgi:hypothetical protein
MPFFAHVPEDVGVGGGRRAQSEVDGAVGEVGDVGDGADAEHLLPGEVGGVDRARNPPPEDVERHEAELADASKRR